MLQWDVHERGNGEPTAPSAAERQRGAPKQRGAARRRPAAPRNSTLRTEQSSRLCRVKSQPVCIADAWLRRVRRRCWVSPCAWECVDRQLRLWRMARRRLARRSQHSAARRRRSRVASRATARACWQPAADPVAPAGHEWSREEATGALQRRRRRPSCGVSRQTSGGYVALVGGRTLLGGLHSDLFRP